MSWSKKEKLMEEEMFSFLRNFGFFRKDQLKQEIIQEIRKEEKKEALKARKTSSDPMMSISRIGKEFIERYNLNSMEFKDVKDLSKWIWQERPSVFNTSQLSRSRRSPLRDTKRLDAAINVLIKAGWVRDIGTRKGETYGRRRKDFEVNPQILLWHNIRVLLLEKREV